MHWSGPENIAWVTIDDESVWAILDSGSTINAVTPEFLKAHSLDVGPLSDLVDGTLKINGFGGLFPTLGLCHHKGSSRRGEGLWWRLSCSSCPGFDHLWITSPSYPWYTYYQSNCECDQRKWDWWALSLHWMDQKYPAYWQDVEQNTPLKMTQLPVKPLV